MFTTKIHPLFGATGAKHPVINHLCVIVNMYVLIVQVHMTPGAAVTEKVNLAVLIA